MFSYGTLRREVYRCKVKRVNSPQKPVARVRNARGDGARLRDEIVSAATVLLQSGPAESVTLRAVARAAGITAPSIYRHFGSVDDILRAVIEQTFAELEERLRDAVADAAGSEKVWNAARAYLAFAQDRPEQYRLLFGGAWNAADLPDEATREREERAQLGLESLQILIDALAAAVAAGVSASTDPARDAVALWTGLHGLATLRRTTPLFPWPADMEGHLIRRLARLEPESAAATPTS
jgi:AcrR family transcriptional regulator